MKQYLNNKKTEILAHLVFWVSVWFFFVYFFSYNSEDSGYVMWFSSALLPVAAFITYIMVNFLIPRFLLTRKYIQFALYSFYTIVVSSYLVVLIIYACLISILKFDVSSVPPMAKNFVSVMILLFLVAGIVSLIKLLNHNFFTISRNKELQNTILAAQLQLKEQELNYLKRQIHPHFLFNTLNTIYGLALSQSRHTPDVILKLSNLLDYILYQVNNPKVSLKAEILHINEYIQLERIRFHETLDVKFSAPEVEETISIAPMILIPFVENAFKHGNIRNGFLSIHIDIEIINETLTFEIGNSVRSEKEGNVHGGIGLQNTRKRLEMLYPENHHLEIIQNESWFQVCLSINQLTNAKNCK